MDRAILGRPTVASRSRALRHGSGAAVQSETRMPLASSNRCTPEGSMPICMVPPGATASLDAGGNIVIDLA